MRRNLNQVNKFTDDEILKLKETCEVTVDDTQLEFEGQECCICLLNYENGDKAIKFKKCIHKFHSDCITHWLKINANCPMCKRDKKCELEVVEEEETPENQNEDNNVLKPEIEIELPQIEEPLTNDDAYNDTSTRVNLLHEQEEDSNLDTL